MRPRFHIENGGLVIRKARRIERDGHGFARPAGEQQGTLS
jgi:hypothetical protein